MQSNKIKDLITMAGIPQDGSVMVHSSFKPFSWEGFEPEPVLCELMDYWNNGCLLMPSMSWRFVRPTTPFFDALKTPSNTGILSEIFRSKYAEFRSLHPTHSVSGKGRGAQDFLNKHHLDNTPCSINSPFGQLVEQDGWVLLFGISMDCCTIVHYVEEVVAPEIYLKDKSEIERYVCRSMNGEEVFVDLIRHRLLPRNYWIFQDILAQQNKLRIVHYGNIILRAFKAKDLAEIVFKCLNERPSYLLSPKGQPYRMM